VGDWEEFKDAETGKVFFYNHTTGASQWEAPPEFLTLLPAQKLHRSVKNDTGSDLTVSSDSDPENASNRISLHSTDISSQSAPMQDWEECIDQQGQKYYHNHVTGASQWHAPPAFSSSASKSFDQRGWGLKRQESIRLKTIGDWEEFKDDQGNIFYYNHRTHGSQWEPPPGFAQTQAAKDKGAPDWTLKRQTSMRVKSVGQWQEFHDEQSGQPFYYNTVTGANQWERPQGFDAQAPPKPSVAQMLAQQRHLMDHGAESTDDDGHIYNVQHITTEDDLNNLGI